MSLAGFSWSGGTYRKEQPHGRELLDEPSGFDASPLHSGGRSGRELLDAPVPFRRAHSDDGADVGSQAAGFIEAKPLMVDSLPRAN